LQGLPISIQNSFIDEGEIQFGQGGNLVFHDIKIVDGNVHVVASLTPDEQTKKPPPNAKRYNILNGDSAEYSILAADQIEQPCGTAFAGFGFEGQEAPIVAEQPPQVDLKPLSLEHA
jgi:hypothetical protein